MNISFKDVDMESYKSFINVQGNTTSNNESTVSKVGNNSGYALDIASKVTENAYKSQGKTMKEVMQQAQNMNVEAYRDYMTVMSNCVSSEDLQKLQEEGFNPGSTEFDDVVTIVDHIKAAVLKGGTEVIGYTDSISKDALLEITKDPAYADMLSKQFASKDIPLTQENINDISSNYEKLSEVKPLGEATVKYMVENSLEPSVVNLYTAAYASGKDASYQGHGYYSAGDVGGYYAKKSDSPDLESILPQMKEIVESAGYPSDEQNMKAATWLVLKGIPLTQESFSNYMEITGVKLPMEYSEFVNHATDAIMDGIPIEKYNLSRRESFRSEAVNIYNEVQSKGTIKGRRVLEEVRLSMTVEANYRLLRSGYTIDTAPMEELVKRLKEMEKEFSINLTHDEDEITAVRKKDLYDSTNELIEKLKASPAAVSWVYEKTDTLTMVADKAQLLTQRFKAASDGYEALMTAPRRDLGDSIQKAFRNVDDLLREMNLDVNEENARAVRILGYNGIELNLENIESVREKDRLLTRTIQNLTPAKVLGMIRSDMNPVTMPIEELDMYLENQDTAKEDMLTYSRFLYQLEKNKDINSEEREAYIGIYKLINQLEKGDYSALGVIESVGSEFTLDNLSSAVKSSKHKAMNYKVDDNFGELKGSVLKNLKDIIEGAKNSDVEEQLKSDEANEIRENFKTETWILEMLRETQTPISAENIEDMNLMLNSPLSVFDRLRSFGFKKELKTELESKEKTVKEFKEFTGSVKDFLENRVFGNTMEDFTLESSDVRSIKKVYQHMEFLEQQSDKENYIIPTRINDEEVAINLRIKHDEKESKAEITFESEKFGQVKGMIVSQDNGLSGTFKCTVPEGMKILNDKKEIFSSALDKVSDTDVISTEGLYKAAKAFIEFVQDAA